MIGSRARFRRQYGVASCTPCTSAIYKPARLPSIPSPAFRDWFRFFASCCEGDFELIFAVCSLVMSSYENKAYKLIMAVRPINYLYLTLCKLFW